MKKKRVSEVKKLKLHIDRIDRNVEILAETLNALCSTMQEDHESDIKTKAMVYQLLAHNKLIEVEEVSS